MDSSRGTLLTPAGFFVLRSTLLCGTEWLDATPEASLTNPVIREAISLASRSLFDEATDPARSVEKARPALCRYLARMSGRPTPFSLMAGYSHGRIGTEMDAFLLRPRHDWLRIVRMNVDCIAKIVDRTLENKSARQSLRWCIRPDLAIFCDIVRKTQFDPQDARELVYVDVAKTPPLDEVLRKCQGFIPFTSVVEMVASYASNYEQAYRFVDQLIFSGILVPEYYPSVSTDDEVTTIKRVHPVLAASLDAIRATPLRRDINSEVTAIKASISAAKGECGRDDLIFDVVKPLERGTVSAALCTELASLVRVFQRIVPYAADGRIADFAKAFRDRYEGREVRLVEALDPNRGYDFPVAANYEATNAGDRFDWLLRLFEDAAVSGKREVVLDDGDLPSEVLWEPKEIISVAFSLAQNPTCIYEPRIGASPGTAMFARATSFIPELRDMTRDALRVVFDADNAVGAEVTYFLSLADKYANFGQFPRLLPYEIPLNALAPHEDHTIDVNELLLSIRNGEFTLRRQSTGQRVVPKVTSAAVLDRSTNTSVGRFLGAISRLDNPVRWTWDRIGNARFCPRVCYRNHVLTPARWNLDASVTGILRAAKTKRDQRYLVDRLRETLGLPRHILYRERLDLALPVDLDSPYSVEAWLDIVKEQMVLTEQFPVDRTAVWGTDGPYHHEFVVPFTVTERDPVLHRKPKGSDASSRSADLDAVMPGSSVLFLKVYGDTGELLAVMDEIFQAHIKHLVANGGISHWFFLPFSDPRPHLRVRLFGDGGGLYGPILQSLRALLEPYVSQGVIDRVVIDTYDRETYRYGGPLGMSLCERLFAVSSEYAIEFHSSTEYDADPSDTRMIDWVNSQRAVLEAGFVKSEEAMGFAAALGGVGRHAKDKSETPHCIGGKIFRTMNKRLMDAEGARAAFGRDRYERMSQLLGDLRGEVARGRVHRDYSELLRDILHVHTIRLITTWSRGNNTEAVTYDILLRALRRDAALSLNVSGQRANPASSPVAT